MANLEKKIRNLPFKQQVALYVLLKTARKRGKFTFANFINDMVPLFYKNEQEKLPRILGGLLSSLMRNGMIERLSGGRHPIWRLNPELHKNSAKYRKTMRPSYAYWIED